MDLNKEDNCQDLEDNKWNPTTGKEISIYEVEKDQGSSLNPYANLLAHECSVIQITLGILRSVAYSKAYEGESSFKKKA